MQHWEEVVGPQIATVAHPEGVRTRVLFVTVTDAIWLQQLTFYHAQILQQLQQVLGDVPIVRVHFTLTTLSRPVATGAQAAPEPPPLSLTAAEERQVLEGTAAIADADLREAVRRAWRRGWEARR
jgi:predicted nucleic acid-binding Zn ribbon protein